jgi:hypothetical protein
MASQISFLDCPAYLDESGSTRCGLPAEVKTRFLMRSTSGPLESAMIRCPAGHWFNGPIEFLTFDKRTGTYPHAGNSAGPRSLRTARWRGGGHG